jgi:NADPH:quinone reductase-like Zn-dependent oxidoreductase
MNGRAVRLLAKAADLDSLALEVQAMALPRPGAGEVVVEVHAAAVNPSDVKAAMGFMPYAVFPRTPGRDFAGIVIDGPSGLLGQAVFGSSGDLGIRRDGTHASHLLVEEAGVVLKPAGISLPEAAGIGVPFVTAQEGFLRAGLPQAGDVVLVMGVNGKVGQAAAQIACWCGARVLGVARRAEPYRGHASGEVTMIDASAGDVAARVAELTAGHGADIVFNTVGDPYFAAAHKSLAKAGRQILIAALKPVVEFNIFEFYRGRHTYVGIDTLAFSTVASADVLRRLLPGFAAGALKPYPIEPQAIFPLAEARAGFLAAMGGERDRVVIRP